jgi:hypothetical protein
LFNNTNPPKGSNNNAEMGNDNSDDETTPVRANLGVEDRGAGEVVMLLQNLVDATKENSYCRIYYYSLNKMCIKIIKIYLWCDFSKNA